MIIIYEKLFYIKLIAVELIKFFIQLGRHQIIFGYLQ